MLLDNTVIKRVQSYKYLGVILSEDQRIALDVDRAMNSFLKQFNGMYYKFHYMENSVLQYLFKTFTSSFYGAELWYGSSCYRTIEKIAITYHKAVKRVARRNVWDSNHEACNIVGVQIFKHLIAKRSVCFYYSMLKSKSPCIKPYQNFIRNRSLARSELDNLFVRNYGVTNFYNNPLCALISRINFIERTEPRSSYSLER